MSRRRADFDEVAVAHVVDGVRVRLTRVDDILEAARRLADRRTVTLERAAELMCVPRDRLNSLCLRDGITWPRVSYPLDWVHAYMRSRGRSGADHAARERHARSLRIQRNDVVRIERTEGTRTYVARVDSVGDDGLTVCYQAPVSRGFRERWDAPASYPMNKNIDVPWWRVVDVVRRGETK